MAIFIIEPRMIVAELLSYTLKNIYPTEEVHIFKSGQTAVDLIETLERDSIPDVIISDILLPGLSGMELVERFILLRERIDKEKLKLIIISSIEDVEIMRELVNSGAEGLLNKNTSLAELQECIAMVLEGKKYISDSVKQYLSTAQETSNRNSSYALSPREKELLLKVCTGLTLPEAADELAISTNTAKSYYKNIMKKFKVNRTPEIVMVAIRKGIFIP